MEWCYAGETNLRFDKHVVPSQAGVQQGDPLGPLLFALAVHPLVKRLAESGSQATGDALGWTCFYLDDGLLCGSVKAVSKALKVLQEACPTLGVELNLKQCELVVPSGQPNEDLYSNFPREPLWDEELQVP